ncbi:MAG: nuclear transport factor 2 family protein [Phycisphaerales bacterium]|nr:nuclear transport factor 2 family protein [Phycisphaerales bacterium]
MTSRLVPAFASACFASIAAFAVAAGPAPAEPVQAAGSAPAAAWPADDAGLAKLATGLVTDWMSRTTAPALEAVTQPCFQFLSFEGACDRAGAIERLVAMGAGSPTVSEVVATRVGDALVVTCLVSVTQKAGGAPLPADPSPRLGIWQLADGAWKLAAWASLNMPAVRPAPAAPAFAGDAAVSAEGAAMVGRLLGAQHRKDLKAFGGMLSDGMQVINFKGQKVRKDIERGAEAATIDEPKVADARAARCGDLTVVTCTLTMGQKIGWTKLPADPAPFMAVFQGSGDSAKVIAMANTNKPK